MRIDGYEVLARIPKGEWVIFNCYYINDYRRKSDIEALKAIGCEVRIEPIYIAEGDEAE